MDGMFFTISSGAIIDTCTCIIDKAHAKIKISTIMELRELSIEHLVHMMPKLVTIIRYNNLRNKQIRLIIRCRLDDESINSRSC